MTVTNVSKRSGAICGTPELLSTPSVLTHDATVQKILIIVSMRNGGTGKNADLVSVPNEV
jgi:hypothetical protein